MKRMILAILVMTAAASAWSAGGSRYMDFAGTPVAHYKMDDIADSNDVIDAMGYSNGTSVRNTRLMHTTGKIGGALDFDGTTDYISIADDDKFTFCNGVSDFPFSIAAWVNVVITGSVQTIIGKQDNNILEEFEWDLSIAPSGGIVFNCYSDGAVERDIAASSPILTEGWHFIVANYDGSGSAAGLEIYVDAIDITANRSSENYTSMSPTEAEVYVGAFINCGGKLSYMFPSKMDNLMIFNKALTATDISRLYYGKYNSGKIKSRYCF